MSEIALCGGGCGNWVALDRAASSCGVTIRGAVWCRECAEREVARVDVVLAAEKARAERLAEAAENVLMQVYAVSRNAVDQSVNTYSISACELEPLREALKPYMPGDLGDGQEEVE